MSGEMGWRMLDAGWDRSAASLSKAHLVTAAGSRCFPGIFLFAVFSLFHEAVLSCCFSLLRHFFLFLITWFDY